MTMPTPLVSVAWLAAHLGDPQVVILDCRFTLGQPDAGRERYAAAHIPGAVYLDLDRDLAGPMQAHGGRHPLPDLAIIAAKLGAAGIKDETQVVVYDETGEMAARCWWLLRYLGHGAVAVLDGGFGGWTAAGHLVTANVSQPTPRTFTPRPQPDMVAEMTDVRDRAPGVVVVDSRAPERYAGQPNPLDPKPGHIPGAVNRFWKEALQADNTWKGAAEQAARLGDLRAADGVIVHCGSGVTACPNLLALELAGISGAKLYVGSYSDWCSYPENPVER